MLVVADISKGVIFLKSIGSVQGMPHEVSRENVFNDVIELYTKGDIIREYPISIVFTGEIAVDAGGVQRDMYSAFWEKAYKTLFDGATLPNQCFTHRLT